MMTTSKAKKFDFYKNNKVEEHFRLTEAVVKLMFQDWLKTKDIKWINYYDSRTIIRNFVTSEKGLCSVFKEKQFEDLYEILQPIITEHEQQSEENPKIPNK